MLLQSFWDQQSYITGFILVCISWRINDLDKKPEQNHISVTSDKREFIPGQNKRLQNQEKWAL